MRAHILVILFSIFAIAACKKDDLTLSGEPSTLGAVGNEFSLSSSIPGIGAVSGTVVSINDGISTIEGSFEVTDSDLLDMLEAAEAMLPEYISVSGNTVTGHIDARFTTDGVAVVLPEGELIACKYDASVGDEWNMKVAGNDVTHKVTQKSSEDDYPWGFYLIKVVTMTGTGYGIPGLENGQVISNHRFGPVGIKFNLEGGETLSADIFSLFDND